ncbi:MAG: DUF4262 domain-containing protein [Mobilicoccus sp.]|nr:DUF4262 domain-containing protein [Mobilicoccus sp.]
MRTTAAEVAYEDQMRRRMIDGIRRMGCWCTYVFGDGDACECEECGELGPPPGAVVPSTTPRPPFCYTTGLHGIGHPELIVHALSQSDSGHLLNVATQRVLRGSDFLPGEVVDLDGLLVTVEEVPNPGAIFFVANDFYGRPPHASVEGLQLTWADETGAFPWDDHCSPWARTQPRPGEYRA